MSSLRCLPILTTTLFISAVLAFAAPETAKVTASSLNLRSGPSTKNEALASLPQDSLVEVLERRGDWARVKTKLSGRELEGWVAARYLGPVEPTAPPAKPDAKPAKPIKSPETRAEKLAFIRDPKASTLDLLGERGAKWRAIAWGHEDYPGGGKGANEDEARALATALTELCPERRANTGPFKLPYEAKKLVAKLKPVPGQEDKKLHEECIVALEKMRVAAKGDGITLTVLSAWRSEARQKELAKESGNPDAVAQGLSTHNYGLAIDFAMQPGCPSPILEITTRPFTNVQLMRSSPVHKWLFFFAREFGFHPYSHEPWHWEYNPPGFAERYP